MRFQLGEIRPTELWNSTKEHIMPLRTGKTADLKCEFSGQQMSVCSDGHFSELDRTISHVCTYESITVQTINRHNSNFHNALIAT